MNKIIKHVIISFCTIVLVLENIQPISAAFVQCDNYINIKQEPYQQSLTIGIIYDNSIAQIIDKNNQGWVKIKSGDIIGWCDSYFFVQDIPQNEKYTVAIIHPQKLSVYTKPNNSSSIYTTVYQDQEIECVNYENDWLTLAFDDGSYGFIDAYQAELKTYYKTASYLNDLIINNYQPEEQIANYNDQQIIYQEEFYQQPIEEIYFIQQDFQLFEPNYQQEEITEQEYYYLQQQQYELQLINQIEQEYYSEDIDIEEQYQEVYIDDSDNDIIDYADQFLGNPYVYGGNSLTDGIDCSHFVWQVLSNTGHYEGDYTTSDGWANLGESVSSLDNAVAGDVIVYSGHVAIYDGEGGIVQAQGSEAGITHSRDADYKDIIAIRHFD